MRNSSPSAATACPDRRFVSTALAAVLILAACETRKPVPDGCVAGILTGEGATCQALRDGKDRLYSFYADMTGYRLGEQVCVCGPVAEMSFCQQGTVIEVTHLDRECPAGPQ